MEAKPNGSPNLEIFTPKSDDFKYICSLSTILVATIQEVKDRVSQIELIFCSQLFPKFQSNLKSFQRSEEVWKERETNLLGQIEELKLSLLKEREEKEKLMKEIECKDQSLVAEQSKRRDVIRDFSTLKERYNSLKSQYSYLIGKLEGNPGNLKSPKKARGEKMVKAHSPKRSHEVSGYDEIDTKEVSPYAELRKPKLSLNSLSTSPRPPLNNTSENEDKLSWCQTNKASSSPRLQQKSISGKSKTETTSGQKRPITWRDTRANQKPCGTNRDPHDDFLDTPIEMAKKSESDKRSSRSAYGTLLPEEPCRDKLPVEEPIALQVPPPQDMDFNSDEETQDLNSNKVSIKANEKSFKFIEPVRKKAERENLKGIECKQCKKFYDAVLPENMEGKEQLANDIGNSLRCEHHEGVSRHRYRYAPPMTPEGFWNIGFESEM
ncbi:hypothetical protein LUZ61_011620 [Rhynchospora tenuis]|uniref:DNA endonuclease activator Ctp1 C-terminal domain-containing protein n=1 Tax=Rhynchospora tenuis TaxID=198213 RepID=A0AAD6A1H7_9POAL|nr:hypothetical protein LUZ61_011620 [Rhynchospora tenuis]